MNHATELNDDTLDAVIGGAGTCPEKPKLREKNPYDVKTTTKDTNTSTSTQTQG